jgi:hypothetical protein
MSTESSRLTGSPRLPIGWNGMLMARFGASVRRLDEGAMGVQARENGGRANSSLQINYQVPAIVST